MSHICSFKFWCNSAVMKAGSNLENKLVQTLKSNKYLTRNFSTLTSLRWVNNLQNLRTISHGSTEQLGKKMGGKWWSFPITPCCIYILYTIYRYTGRGRRRGRGNFQLSADSWQLLGLVPFSFHGSFLSRYGLPLPASSGQNWLAQIHSLGLLRFTQAQDRRSSTHNFLVSNLIPWPSD